MSELGECQDLKSVIVLLSTYNGEKYLEEQLDSIFAQDKVNVSMFVRDDGSTDRTCSILEKYSKNYPLKWYVGENIGVCSSYMELVSRCEVVDYYAYSDQDDYWYPNKLYEATKLIGENDNPILYVSNLTVVDEHRNFIAMHWDSLDPHRNLIQRFDKLGVNACTMVMNKKMMVLLKSDKYKPRNDLMKQIYHDRWTVFIADLIAYTIYDHNSYIDYRQHSSNTAGFFKRNTLYKRIINFIKSKPQNVRINLAQELLIKTKENIKETDREKLQLVCEYRKRFKYRLKLLLYLLNSANAKSNFQIHIKIILGRF